MGNWQEQKKRSTKGGLQTSFISTNPISLGSATEKKELYCSLEAISRENLKTRKVTGSKTGPLRNVGTRERKKRKADL